MTAEQIIEALAHGLADLDAEMDPDRELGKMEVREFYLPQYREVAERVLLPRLWEAGLDTQPQEAG